MVLMTKSELEHLLELTESLRANLVVEDPLHQTLAQLYEVLTLWPICGLNRRVCLVPEQFSETGELVEARLIVRWGAEITEKGVASAEV